MPLHLTKVAVGCRTIESLEKRFATRANGGEVRVVTRMRPKRMAELLEGGALYWIVKHRIIACAAILRFEDRSDGRLDIVCSEQLQAVPPLPKRAHQGWRYLAHEDAPKPGDNDDTGLSLLPPGLYGRLSALALL
ncbi:DUF1489 family protein [Sphingomonas astaxanthinifaciens]|uniref:Lysophospholipase n=1 Tax=Sphingomonas astaxanthinifaciens DSM 22298 TaxID=1123267 RepID=A0ABQ5ZA35_9SPHN|nr:DUF1489 family protein [Sphingomonas astaxanthinifaciens]GLR48316.1 lysophospholipase [Sphingomonas astaxanthinifaciens DSM 22298]